MIFRGKLLADFRLIRRGFPVHVDDVLLWAQGLLRIAMAVQAPLHGQFLGLKDQGHLIDLAVAGGTADAFAYVNAVVEINEIRKTVDAHPFDGFIGAVAFAYGFKIRGVFEKDGVTIHAGFGRRDSGDSGDLHASVAIAAVDAIVADVMFVAELHGLVSDDILARVIRGARGSQDNREPQRHRKNGEEQAEASDRIRTAVKNLGHFNCARE